MSTLLPARINLQIRDGVQNELVKFDVEIAASRPSGDGRTNHEVELSSIVGGLAMALRDQIAEYRKKTTVPEEAEAWLTSMRDWTFEGLVS